MKTRYWITAAVLAVASITYSCTDKEDGTTKPTNTGPVTDLGWTFETTPSWSDEFEGAGCPSTVKWRNDVGVGSDGGWGNRELEYYTDACTNAKVIDGNLVIEARKEVMGGRQYTSSRMKSNFSQKYGRFEARMKLPKGGGTWPAFWMLASNNASGWPTSGELDVMEHVGKQPNVIHQTIHCFLYNGGKNTQKGADRSVTNAFDDYHTYRVDWTPYSVTFFTDDIQVFQYVNTNEGINQWPFNAPFFMILNLAIGGNWGGTVDDSIFPTKMTVDYVRVYKMIEKK
ncbi:MAG: glycoside hydrolase family 16 protein [Bacteroidota bacterium]